MKDYIPETKDDLQAVERLNTYSFGEIRSDVPALLIFLQDLHWDVSHGIASYLVPYVNDIKDDLLDILASDDFEWKFGILRILIEESPVKLDEELVSALRRISEAPTRGELLVKLDKIARKIIAKNDELDADNR